MVIVNLKIAMCYFCLNKNTLPVLHYKFLIQLPFLQYGIRRNGYPGKINTRTQFTTTACAQQQGIRPNNWQNGDVILRRRRSIKVEACEVRWSTLEGKVENPFLYFDYNDSGTTQLSLWYRWYNRLTSLVLQNEFGNWSGSVKKKLYLERRIILRVTA